MSNSENALSKLSDYVFNTAATVANTADYLLAIPGELTDEARHSLRGRRPSSSAQSKPHSSIRDLGWEHRFPHLGWTEAQWKGHIQQVIDVDTSLYEATKRAATSPLEELHKLIARIVKASVQVFDNVWTEGSPDWSEDGNLAIVAVIVQEMILVPADEH